MVKLMTTRSFIVWSVCDCYGRVVETFPYKERHKADARAEELNAQRRYTDEVFYVQMVKEQRVV